MMKLRLGAPSAREMLENNCVPMPAQEHPILPLLGVAGGMGPLATADFMAKLVRCNNAGNDQGHLPVLACSIPQIPDRTSALLHGGASPLPAMLSVIALLTRAGVRKIAIPCNTAHYWYDDLQSSTPVPILHVVDCVAESLRSRSISGGEVVVLGTPATHRVRLYDERLANAGYAAAYPDSRLELQISRLIAEIKSGLVEQRRELQTIIERLLRDHAAVILACTELPLIFDQAHNEVIDSTRALAEACVAWGSNYTPSVVGGRDSGTVECA